MLEPTDFHKSLGISIEGDFYVFEGDRYKTLQAAVEYACNVKGVVEQEEITEFHLALGSVHPSSRWSG
ncbi:MAG: hypothetical protein VW583_09610 [Betaproteobacteria bacterium]